MREAKVSALVHDSFPAGGGSYIEFAVGRLHVLGFDTDYDYCDFGLIPDYWVDGLPLIRQDASDIVFQVKRCAISSSSSKRCLQYQPTYFSERPTATIVAGVSTEESAEDHSLSIASPEPEAAPQADPASTVSTDEESVSALTLARGSETKDLESGGDDAATKPPLNRICFGSLSVAKLNAYSSELALLMPEGFDTQMHSPDSENVCLRVLYTSEELPDVLRSLEENSRFAAQTSNVVK